MTLISGPQLNNAPQQTMYIIAKLSRFASVVTKSVASILFLNRISSMRLPAISMVVAFTVLNSVSAGEINLIHRYNFESDAARDCIGKFDGQLTRDFALTEKPDFADLAPEGAIAGNRSIILDPEKGKRSGIQFHSELLKPQGGTVAIWFQPYQSHDPGSVGYLFFSPPIPSGLTIAISQGRDDLKARLVDSPQLSTASQLRMNEWNHVAFTWSAEGVAQLYLNGQLISQGVFDPKKIDWKHFVRVGAFHLDEKNSQIAHTQYRGAIYDLQIYNGPVDKESIRLLYDKPGEVVADSIPLSVDPGSLKLAEVFSSGMVLQRDRSVVVWGEAADDIEVTVRFAKQTKSTVSRAGRWQLELDPLEATAVGRDLILESSDGGRIILSDVVVGEVWLAAGQSNMVLQVGGSRHGKAALKNSDNPDLRFFIVPMKRAKSPDLRGLHWKRSSPQTTGGLSAVAYYFANDLQRTLGVPVGIVQIAYGGSSLESWVSPEALSVETAPAYYNFLKTCKPEYLERTIQIQPSRIRERMLMPYMPYSVRGVIWYQGEGNSGRPKEYLGLWRSFRKELRALFEDPELPIYTVQLARLTNANWSEIRLVQQQLWQEDPNAFMAVTIDIPRDYNEKDHPIHPIIKKPIGLRLARAARNFIYDEDLLPSGPVLKEVIHENGRTRIQFDYAGGRLTTFDGAALRGLYGWAGDQPPIPLMAQIDGSALVIDHAANGVDSLDCIRYGSETDMGAGEDFSPNLVNAEQLPASPFFYERGYK